MPIEFVTPTFQREAGRPAPACPPGDAEAWSALTTMDRGALVELGLRPWNDPAQPDSHDPPALRTATLWLLPAEWYDHIPDGQPLVDINGRSMKFSKGVSDNDMRFGCLAYGILVQEAK